MPAPTDIVLLRHSGYSRVFNTAILVWLEKACNFGFGLKSFRIKCWDILEKDNMTRKGATRYIVRKSPSSLLS